MSAHEWDIHNVCLSKSSRTVEEETSSNIGAVITEGGFPGFADTDRDSDSVYQMIGGVKVALIPSRNVSETKATVKDVP